MSIQTRCTTCNIGFDSADAMRAHYGSDHHLANVRLRVDGKAPMTKSQFEQSRMDVDDEGPSDAPTFYCKLCNKVFRSVQTLQSHVKSTAHLIKKEERIIARDSDAASMLTSTSLGSAALGLHRRHKAHHKENLRRKVENEAKPKVSYDDREADCGCRRCLFCGLGCESTEEMLSHLLDSHSFSVPLLHRCRDVDGLLDYLGRKINGLMCIVCNEKTRSYESLEAVRAHMEASQHQRLDLSPEYQEFYEGTLADLDKTEAPKHTGEQLILADTKKTIFRRDQDGLFQRIRETDATQEKRKLITQAHTEQQALIKKERYEAMAPMLKLQQKELKESRREMQKQYMIQGIKANKLHPKGYDGEGEVN